MNFVIETSSGVRSIAISNPAKRNSLSLEMLDDLAQALKDADGDPTVRVILLQGLPGLFSAGTDYEALDGASDYYEREERLLEAIDGLNKPLLAAVNGPAVGMAVIILLACDMVFCGEHALFSLPFSAMGLVPPHGVAESLAACCGQRFAAEKLLLSEPISAEEALRLRLVNAVFPDEAVVRETAARALRLCRLPPHAVRAAKALVRSACRSDLPQARRDALEAHRAQCRTDEASLARAAFLEGRKPDFSMEGQGS